jgi:hypothetical protein
MSLKQDILKHKSQLSPQFRKAVFQLAEDADPDKPFIKSALVVYSGDQPLAIPGIGNITPPSSSGVVSAQDISPNGLKRLLEQPRVSYVDGDGDGGSRFQP